MDRALRRAGAPRLNGTRASREVAACARTPSRCTRSPQMSTTSRNLVRPTFRTGTGPRRTRGETPRGRFLRALLAHAGMLRAYLHPDACGGLDAPAAHRATAVRRGRSALHAALDALLRLHVPVHLTTARAPVAVPSEPETGGWAIVHANPAQTRRTLRRRWFPWTLRAWLTTPGEGALALFSWGTERPSD